MNAEWQGPPQWEEIERRPVTQTYAKSLAPLPAGLPDLNKLGLIRPSTCPGVARIPIPSCWGSRGSPWSLRCLAVGGPAKAKNIHRSLRKPFYEDHSSESENDIEENKKVKKEKRFTVVCDSTCAPVVLKLDAQAPHPHFPRAATAREYGRTQRIYYGSQYQRLRSPGGTHRVVDRSQRKNRTQDHEQISELCRVLREEFAACDTQQEIEKVNRIASEILSEGNAKQSGGLAYRIREAASSMCSSGTFAYMDCRHRLAFRKTLRCEMKRRVAELARSITASSSWKAPSYLGAQDQEQIGDLCRVLREELAACHTQKEIEKVNRTASKILSEGNAMHLCMSGRLAYRIREAASSMCSSSTFASLDCRHQLAFRKILRCEVKRRAAELSGWGEKDAEEIALASDMVGKDLQNDSPPRKSPFLDPLLSDRSSSRPLSRDPSKNRPAEEFFLSSPQNVFTIPPSRKLATVDTVVKTTTISEHEERRSVSNSPEDDDDELESDPEDATKSRYQRAWSMTSAVSSRAQARMSSRSSTLSGLQEKAQTTARASMMSRATLTNVPKLIKVYKFCSEDIGLHHDELYRALQLVGVLKPKWDLIEEAFKRISRYVNMNQNEWIEFVKIYLELQVKAIADAFVACDLDRSGYVDVPELVKLMKEFNIEPMPHVLQEVLAEVDKDNTNSLDLDEFTAVMHVIHVREGFTKRECEEFDGLFKRYDRDRSGEIDVNEMYSIVFWLGFAYNLDTIQEIVKDVDCDGSGMLNEVEFLTCMRRLREAEIKRLRKAIADSDADGNGFVCEKELTMLMSGLACNVDMEVVREVAEDVGVLDILRSRGLDLEELWQILVVYRAREGFSINESMDIENAFKRFDKTGADELSTLEVGKILRWLGYTPTFEEQQSLVAKVDVDCSGKLNVSEFRKLVRMLQVKENDIAREAFFQRDKYCKGHLSKEMATFAFRAAGCLDSHYMTPKFSDEDFVEVKGRREIALDTFLRLAMAFQKKLRRAFRDNNGFSPGEMADLKKSFASYDEDGSGEISNKELQTLIQDLMPRLAHDPAMRPKLLQLLQEIDADASGTINFEDFVRLMQEINGMRVQERLAQEQDAVTKTKFSVKEVEEFRELFVAGDEGDGNSDDFLAFSKLKVMLGTICPLGNKNFKELKQIVKGVIDSEVDESTSGVSFPEFLLLMRQLLDVDFAGIQGRLASEVGSP